MDRPSMAPASILEGRPPSGRADQDHAQALQHLHKSDLPLKSEAAQRAFFERSLERALAAEAKAGLVERWFRIAGAILCVRFAGEGLIEALTPALAHLAIPAAAKADGVFHVFDSASTGIEMVPPICSRDHLTGRGDIWSLQSRRFRSTFLGAETAVALMDVETSTAVFWIQSAEGLPYWAKASPMRNLLHWWMEGRGCQLVHGAAVGLDGEGLLITGPGGLGKSTTALACLNAGLQYLADDFLVVEPGDPARAHSLYSTGKLDWAQMKRFPRFAGLARNHGSPLGDKAVLYLHPAFQDRLVRSLDLKAILMPRIVARPESGLVPVSRAMLERAASFSTITLLPHASANTMAFIGRLVASLPGLALELGSDIAAVPATVESLLRRPAAQIAAIGTRGAGRSAQGPSAGERHRPGPKRRLVPARGDGKHRGAELPRPRDHRGRRWLDRRHWRRARWACGRDQDMSVRSRRGPPRRATAASARRRANSSPFSMSTTSGPRTISA